LLLIVIKILKMCKYTDKARTASDIPGIIFGTSNMPEKDTVSSITAEFDSTKWVLAAPKL
jgi:hypothetical protein